MTTPQLQCPVCGQAQAEGQQRCDTCGGWLDSKMNDPLLGREVGHFRLDSLIGRGGMGAIYLATHKVLGTSYAVKLLHPQLASDPTILERFRREAIAASQLKHNNIVFIADFGWTEGIGAYIVMEYLEGVSLGQALRDDQSFTPRQLLELFRQICRGLQAAHKQKIVHRDLKPDNIFLCDGEDDDDIHQVKLLDFGIARITEEGAYQPVTLSEVAIGTPHYMSPEQAQAHWDEVDQRTDIYALGVILFKILTGETPFLKGATHEVLGAKARGEMIQLHEFRPDLKDTPLEAVVHKCMAFERDDRYPHTKALFNALEAALAAFPETPLTTSPLRSKSTPTRVLTPSHAPSPGLAGSASNVRLKERTDPPSSPSSPSAISSPSFVPVSDPALPPTSLTPPHIPAPDKGPMAPLLGQNKLTSPAAIGAMVLMGVLLLWGGYWIASGPDSSGDSSNKSLKAPLPPLRPPPGAIGKLPALGRPAGSIPALPSRSSAQDGGARDAGVVKASPRPAARARSAPPKRRAGPKSYLLTITSRPKARVYPQGQAPCQTPCAVRGVAGTPLSIKLRRRGYRTRSFTWTPKGKEQKQKKHFRLFRKRRRRSPRRRDIFKHVPI